MMGHKTLAEVRAELEAAVAQVVNGTVPVSDTNNAPERNEVIESLRRFLNAGRNEKSEPGRSAPAERADS